MLGKTRLILAWLFLLTCSVATAQNEQFTEGENNRTTFQTLKTNITVDFFEHRFEDVMKELRDQTGVTFVLDESAGDNNLDAESLITMSQENMRAATVLAFMFRPFQCTWSIRDGVVVILSEDAALDQLNLMVFDCSDLLAKIQPRVERQRGGRGTVAGGFGGGGGAGTAGGVFSVQEDEDDPFSEDDPFADVNDPEMSDPFADDDAEVEDDPFGAEPAQDELVEPQSAEQVQAEEEPQPPVTPPVVEVTVSPHDQLVDLIQQTVEPHSWTENGGVARIVTINDLVVIRQTQVNLREIETLLELLRSSGL
ncbi:MAG: hypothetical protein ACR2NP_19535 [Pirellulaceae bacterium]